MYLCNAAPIYINDADMTLKVNNTFFAVVFFRSIILDKTAVVSEIWKENSLKQPKLYLKYSKYG